MMQEATLSLALAFCILSSSSASVHVNQEKYTSVPPTPLWPDIFSIDFDVLVEDYGENWKSPGTLNYHWPNKTFRSDFIGWCLPLFDSGSHESNNYTCSFMATKESMYFVNHTSPDKIWSENDCCLFEAGLGATPPDWMENCQYNGTDKIQDIEVDVWWFPGTSDPNKPCYGYWNRRDKIYTPVRFFGLSSVGPTILNYYGFKPDELEENIDLSLPHTGCDKVCEPPVLRKKKPPKNAPVVQVGAPWPNWPSCD